MEQLADIATFVKVVDLGSFTAAATALYRQGSHAIAALDNVQLEIARFQTEPRGTLRVNAPISFTLLHLQQKLPSFLDGAPEEVEDLLSHNCIVYTLGHDALRAGKLVRVLPKLRLPELGVYVVYPERRNALPKLRAFIDFMIASFGPEPEWDRGLSFP